MYKRNTRRAALLQHNASLLRTKFAEQACVRQCGAITASPIALQKPPGPKAARVRACRADHGTAICSTQSSATISKVLLGVQSISPAAAIAAVASEASDTPLPDGLAPAVGSDAPSGSSDDPSPGGSELRMPAAIDPPPAIAS
jgi:hypothetical protein